MNSQFGVFSFNKSIRFQKTAEEKVKMQQGEDLKMPNWLRCFWIEVNFTFSSHLSLSVKWRRTRQNKQMVKRIKHSGRGCWTLTAKTTSPSAPSLVLETWRRFSRNWRRRGGRGCKTSVWYETCQLLQWNHQCCIKQTCLSFQLRHLALIIHQYHKFKSVDISRTATGIFTH